MCISGRAIRTVQVAHLQFIDVWVEDSIDESNARALVWVLVGQLDVDFPVTSGKRC